MGHWDLLGNSELRKAVITLAEIPVVELLLVVAGQFYSIASAAAVLSSL